MRFISSLLMLIWKNWILHRRHYVVTIFEIVVPISGSLVICLTLGQLSTSLMRRSGIRETDASIYEPWEPMEENLEFDSIWFAPNTTETKELMDRAFGQSKLNFTGFNSEERIVEEAKNYKGKLWGAVIFSAISKSNIPPVLKYKLRPLGSYSVDLPEENYNNEKPSLENYERSSSYERFVHIQTLIDLAYIKLYEETKRMNTSIKLLVREMPYPPFKSLQQDFSSIRFISVVICSSFFIFYLIVVKRVMEEKNNRAKEIMKMMGMSTTAYWGSTFISNFIIMFIISIIIIALYTAPINEVSLLLDTSLTLIFVVVLLYCASSLLFCFCLSVLFTKVLVGITLLTILLITTITIDYLQSIDLKMKLAGKILTCLIPNMAISWACKIMDIHYIAGNSAQWNIVMEPAFGTPDSFCIGTVIGMMIFSCILYTILLLYLDLIWPWQPGVPKSPLFCFTSYLHWLHPKKKVEEEYVIPEDLEYFEEEPRHSTPSIIISHLSKVFKVGNITITAVNDLSLNIYPGQITALLGHNGAGKTTTMNILTGIFPPSSGTASINGHHIVMDTDAARSNLGLCPQHNVLFDDLTVEEHLKLFAGFKGVSWSAMKEEITKAIQELGLEDKRRTLSKNLSGGMKRKLSLGCAIIGESQILILDEPTTGLDPESRRAIWNILEGIRSKRTILLTTHYMEEADMLGDRIAIMGSGTIQCYGSPMFLKQKFGTGYQLQVEKADNCRVDDITSLLHRYIPEAKLIKNGDLELIYSLSNATESFSKLLGDLEDSFPKLGVATYGINNTTMDDVFLKIGQMMRERHKMNEDSSLARNIHEETPLAQHKNKSTSLLFQQTKALFKKRLYFARRTLSLLIFQLLLPFIAVTLCLIVNLHSERIETDKEFILDLNSMFGEKKYGFYHLANNTAELKHLASYFNKTLEQEDVEVIEVSTSEYPEAKLVELGKRCLESYLRRYLIGGSMMNTTENVSLVAWYNGMHHHLLPLSVNLMTTSFLRYAASDSNAGIQTKVQTIPDRRRNDFTRENERTYFFVMFLPLGIAFLSSNFVLLPIHERVSKAKLLQEICGVNGMLYWLVHFSWDFLVHISSSIIILIPFLVYHGMNGFVASEAVGAVFACLLVYGMSSITLSYLISFVPKLPSTGFTIMMILNTFTGLIPMIMIIMETETEDMGSLLKIMKLFPNFAVSWAVNKIHNLSQRDNKCLKYDKDVLFHECTKQSSKNGHVCCTDQVYNGQGYQSLLYLSDEEGAGKECSVLFITFILWTCAIILLETILPKISRFITQNVKFRNRKETLSKVLVTTGKEDSGVSKERERIQDLLKKQKVREEAIIVENLTKDFGTLRAVNNVTFGVHKEECFGLLGINGAGKTTTFRILVGDLLPTSGNAYIEKLSIKSNLRKFQMQVGYCPQFDALINPLTGRETLELFANLRGIPEDEIKVNVNRMISMCDLGSIADEQTETYSGGSKRKLSLAIALIGTPPVILLDEPTSGIDPVSRRKIWNTLFVLKQLVGVSFIFTSHSMDECEALCNRIAIMVNGEFRCLGSMQSLRAKFGQGYSITIRPQQEDFLDDKKIIELNTYIENSFPGAIQTLQHQGILHYYIPETAMKWSKMFSVMEEAKVKFQLEDYILCGTTLEQIFLSFAHAQTGLAS